MKEKIIKEISKNWIKKHFDEDQRDFFIELLIKLKPKYCLETGFETGTSSVTVCSAAKPEKIICIGMGNNNATIAGNLSNQYNFQLIVGNSVSVLTEVFFKNNFPYGVDFFHVDGGHTYEVATSDLEKTFPFMNNNSIIIVDDYHSIICNINEVNKAVDDFCKNHNLDMKSINTKSGKGMAIIKIK